ncbi:serine hydrolase domain-containing protein [Larkinella soli]|uniref:serine hydrolase domain-containing protein n=1 Tax=Larkinella soli TaxID=1770527 RepID=UPI000FFBADC0|nr:serine hydrolase domain-containing protein [Larkinella soli]
MPTASAQPLETALDAVMRRAFPADRPGGALLVMIGGKEVFRRGYGLANPETKTPVTPETNFRMASVSKQFTAMAILLLEKQGKLSVEDNLLRFFPDFNPAVGRKVKLRHLLTHSSGIRDYETLQAPERKDQIFDREVVELLKPQDATYFEPGSRFQYSNSGFCLLEQIVEKVSGRPYAEWMEEAVFTPLGMTGTTFYEPGKPILNRSIGYALDEKGGIRLSDQSITSGTKGDGCLYTSLTDYRKWADALTTNRLIDRQEPFRRIQRPIEGLTGSAYGLGWFVTETKDGPPTFFHSGSTCGFSNCVVRISETQTLIVLFSNLADYHRPFEDILQGVRSQTRVPADVWPLHRLTR